MLKRNYLLTKIGEIENLILINRNQKINYKDEYIKHLSRLLDSYNAEYSKAIDRDEPRVGEYIQESRPYNLTYRPGSYNIEPWRC